MEVEGIGKTYFKDDSLKKTCTVHAVKYKTDEIDVPRRNKPIKPLKAINCSSPQFGRSETLLLTYPKK
jgi:hypothetical protein